MGLVCAVRHPTSALWLVLMASGIFHCLVVRRGVVHVQIPGADPKQRPLATLMWPTLHAVLVGGSVLLLLIIGRMGYLLWLIFPPVILALAHAAIRAPAGRLGETERQLTELSVALHAAIRGEADDGHDVELEAGGDDIDEFAVSTPERSEAMAARVEALRNKYRPPRSTAARSATSTEDRAADQSVPSTLPAAHALRSINQVLAKNESARQCGAPATATA